MLPFIVIILTVIYFVLKGTGLLDDLARSRRSQVDREELIRQGWFERLPKEIDMNHRLEVFKDFLLDDHEDEEA